MLNVILERPEGEGVATDGGQLLSTYIHFLELHYTS